MSRLKSWLVASAATAVTAAGAFAQQPPPAASPPLKLNVAAPGDPCLTPPIYPFNTNNLNSGAPVADAPAVVDSTPSFASTLTGAGLGDTASVGLGGYIDPAAPMTMFRMRYDAAWGNNRPDRAEMFYAKCGCFRLAPPPVSPQTNARGPGGVETNVDYQELTPYLELVVAPRFSVFANVPVRFLDPTVNPNASGIGDISFGMKYAFVYTADRIITGQLQMFTPTGSPTEGLGNGVWWLQPGILFQERMSPRWSVFGEIHDRIPLAPVSDFAGNVLRYGLGTSYTVVQGSNYYVAPVVEAVGWTVLSGKELADGNVLNASGDTIINAKFGVRIGFGQTAGATSPSGSDLYIGYGRALTGEVWYKDMLRIEYRKFF